MILVLDRRTSLLLTFQTVSNGLALFAELRLTLTGPHLGASHFAPEEVADLADFFADQERRLVA